MKKRKKVIQAGNLVIAAIYTPPKPQDKEHVRAARSKFTTAARRAMNLKTAKRRLELLLAANFCAKDLHITLTYREEDLPNGRDEAKKRVRKFLACLRSQRRKRGQALKYIYVTEGQHGDKRWHHHIVLNSTGEDLDLIRSLWIYGNQVELEYIGNREYDGLASYITKENEEGKPPGTQMWTGSRNLQKPIVTPSWVDDNETLEAPPGSYVLETKSERNEFGSFTYIKYRVIEPKPRKVRPPRRKQNTVSLFSGLNPCITLEEGV